MGDHLATASPRRAELLEAAYRYVLQHGLSAASLRPLAAAVGSSTRVLMYLFGSKDGLVRALLDRARADELAALQEVSRGTGGLAAGVEALWSWLSAEAHRPLLRLWVECYSRSLTDQDGPWADFARDSVRTWTDVLATCQSAQERMGPAAEADRTLALAVLRGALLDLLATSDVERLTAAVHRCTSSIPRAPHS
ncbi:helix-turn-helix domain-containing protein [Kineococcus glutinatus]|uniref:TetR family transcriptional regulator n=1 Tax=Kineococcus glutinatus TaxID=1070872 RepID=A0ABP9H5A5_9ACTN